ncbi:MAG: HlyD family efflux transporter periplasmic adaptor subunit [Actinomycetota bacterium]
MFGDPASELLRPVSSEEFLPPISRWTTLGGLLIVGTVGLAFGLAAITQYKVTVKAVATARPYGELRIVQAARGGTVKRIEVKENQAIAKGEALAYIDDSDLQTQKRQLQGNIQQSQEKLSQIDAQIRALNGRIAAEGDRANSTLALAEAELSHTARDYQDKQATSVAEVKEVEANLRQAQQEWEKAQADLKSAKASLMSVAVALKGAKAKRERYQPLAAAGAIPKDKLEEAQLEVAQQEQALASQTAVVEGQTKTIERQQQAIAAAQAKLQGAKASLNPNKGTVTMAQEKIAQQRATAKAVLDQLKQEKEQLIQQQVEINSQIKHDSLQLQQLETDLKTAVVPAPVAGTIQQINLRNPGQVVRPGDIIAQIVPSVAPLVIKASVKTQDRDKVKIGQEAYIRVDGCPYLDFGLLRGKVKGISPDSYTLPKDANATFGSRAIAGAASYYEITLEPESLELSSGGNHCVIHSGMAGTADIISREETALHFILRKAKLLTDF